jgi:hypothetical protein
MTAFIPVTAPIIGRRSDMNRAEQTCFKSSFIEGRPMAPMLPQIRSDHRDRSASTIGPGAPASEVV